MHGVTAKIAAALIATAGHCVACTIMYPVIRVGPNFIVKVSDQSRVWHGLRLQVTLDSDPAIRQSAVTDEDGFARFQGVHPGSYSLLAGTDAAGMPAGVALDVRFDGPAEATIPVMWPSNRIVAARSLKGALYAPDDLRGPKPPPAGANWSLDVFDGLSGRLLKGAQTTNLGEFNFDNAGPGLYLIKFKPLMMQDLSGIIVVDINPSAPADHLEIALNRGPCGLAYSDLNQCPHGEMRVYQLRGSVADTSGASIANADVVLFDSNDQIVEQSRSDKMGRFALTHSLPGTYQLVAKSNGFAVSRATVHLVSSHDASAHAQIKVELGLAGSCSVAYNQ
jgi:hypothetical protein